jgi:hypothetical protein
VVPVSECDQLFGKPPPLKAAIDFHPVVVREQQKPASRLCRQQRIPPKLEGKLYGFRLSAQPHEARTDVEGASWCRRISPVARRHRLYRFHRSFIAVPSFHTSPPTQNKNSSVASVNSPIDAMIA